MRKWTKTAGVLFMAASAVCTTSFLFAADKGVQDATDPFATSSTTQPSGDATTQPSKGGQGQSVTASQVNVSDAGTVEIHVNDANLVEVLRMLSLQSQKNIIASKDVHGSVTANLYDVTVKEALDAILHANGYDYREKGNFIYVYTTKEIQDMERAAQVKKTEVFRLYYTPAANAVNLIKPVLNPDAQVALTTPSKAGLAAGGTGGTGGNDHAGDDILVITDYQDNLDRARKILKEIDRRPQQVLIEATILAASLNENNALGIDFTILGGVNFSTLGAVGGASSSGGGSTSGGSSGGSSGSSGSSGGSSGPSASTSVNSALTGTIIDNTAATPILGKGYSAVQFGGSGLSLGLITNNVGVFLRALEGVTDTTVLANPKVLVLNKQQGEVHVGDNLGYKTAVATETLTASDVKFLDTGTRLIFRPYIGDNGYIRLEVHPEDSSGSIDQNGLPQKKTTEITTNIMVRDGRTIVIGGLFRDSTTRTRSQIPFLGSLPGVGPLFRQQTDATSREEIIMLLTPHIIKDMDQYAGASEDEERAAERIRVGMRRGLMPWGRERLAESWYELAVQEMNKPHPNRHAALWHLNCAINLNPMFTEAMELRSQVTGKEVTATDDSAIRRFVRQQVMADRAHPSTEPTAPAVVPIDDSKAADSEQPKSGKGQPQAAAPGRNGSANNGQAQGQNDSASANQTAQAANPPAGSKNDNGGVEFTYPSTQPAKNSDATASTSLPDEAVEDAPSPSDQKK